MLIQFFIDEGGMTTILFPTKNGRGRESERKKKKKDEVSL